MTVAAGDGAERPREPTEQAAISSISVPMETTDKAHPPPPPHAAEEKAEAALMMSSQDGCPIKDPQPGAPAEASAPTQDANEASGPPEEAPAAAPDQVKPQEFLDDVVNMVNDYTADGYDALEEFVMGNIPMNAEQMPGLIRSGIQELYVRTKQRLDAALPQFEAAALAQCFEPPPAPAALPAAGGGAAAKDPVEEGEGEDEEALDRQLADLRRGIALNRAAVKQMRKDTRALDLQIAKHGNSADLEAVVSGVDLREVCEGAQALAEGALLLRPLLSRAEKLRTVQPSDHNPETANVTAAKAINKRKMAVSGATLEDLRRLRQAFGAGGGGAAS